MKKTFSFGAIVVMAILLGVLPGVVVAQSASTPQPVRITERNLGGPRLGFTLLPSEGKLREKLDRRGIGTIISQFGWHWEHHITTFDGGPAFITEWIFLVGGVEYGTLIPGLTLTFGIRLPQGFEFGLGPNLLIGGEEGAMTALVIAVGKTFDFGGVSIPVNLAFVTGPTGGRLGFIFGYALERAPEYRNE
jgi:hypothetical protein